jgi:hypothetical protein
MASIDHIRAAIDCASQAGSNRTVFEEATEEVETALQVAHDKVPALLIGRQGTNLVV